MGKISKIQKAGGDLDRVQVIEEWRQLFGFSPPKYLPLRLVQSILAWEEQANALGGLPIEVQRALKAAGGSNRSIPTTDLKPGVTLVREWNGRTYQVSVLEHGFRMDGKNYTSLTAIARKITGAKWSGPRFFGLNTKRGVKHA